MLCCVPPCVVFSVQYLTQLVSGTHYANTKSEFCSRILKNHCCDIQHTITMFIKPVALTQVHESLLKLILYLAHVVHMLCPMRQHLLAPTLVSKKVSESVGHNFRLEIAFGPNWATWSSFFGSQKQCFVHMTE